jgi:hypothetical protein
VLKGIIHVSHLVSLGQPLGRVQRL